MAEREFYPKGTFIKLDAVEYRAYKPARENYRATIVRPGRANLIFEQTSWEELFALLAVTYPFEFEIPDEIDTIVYDKNFKVISHGPD